MKLRLNQDITLAICPFHRGFAFIALTSPLSPVDWGFKVKRGPRRIELSLDAAKQLIERLQPTALVLESRIDPRYRRGKRVRQLQSLIANYARWQSIDLYEITRAEIGECFKATGAKTRYEIAQVISTQLPAIGHRLPPPRKKWMTEDKRLRLFNAAALALTFYCQTGPVAGAH